MWLDPANYAGIQTKLPQNIDKSAESTNGQDNDNSDNDEDDSVHCAC